MESPEPTREFPHFDRTNVTTSADVQVANLLVPDIKEVETVDDINHNSFPDRLDRFPVITLESSPSVEADSVSSITVA